MRRRSAVDYRKQKRDAQVSHTQGTAMCTSTTTHEHVQQLHYQTATSQRTLVPAKILQLQAGQRNRVICSVVHSHP